VIAGHFAAYTYVTPFLKENASITPAYLSALLLALEWRESSAISPAAPV
jgi:predicted MFS family arabinose efflux permease